MIRPLILATYGRTDVIARRDGDTFLATFLTLEQAQQDARDKLANADRGLIDTPHNGAK